MRRLLARIWLLGVAVVRVLRWERLGRLVRPPPPPEPPAEPVDAAPDPASDPVLQQTLAAVDNPRRRDDIVAAWRKQQAALQASRRLSRDRRILAREIEVWLS